MAKRDAEPEENGKSTLDQIIEAVDASETDPSRNLSVQIDHSIREAVRCAQNSGQSASVTVKVAVKPGGGERRVNFAATVTAKLPRPAVSAVTLFADDAGRVHTTNPDQLKLPGITNRSTQEN